MSDELNAPAYDVSKFLDNEGIAVLAVNLFSGEWNSSKEAQTLILDGGGTPSELKDLYEEVNIQILTRGKKREAARLVYAKIKTITDFLLSQSDSVLVNGCEYKGFEPASNLSPLGRDDNERFVYSMNLTTFRKGV